MAEYPDLKRQDFSNASIAQGAVKFCPSPLDTLSNNNCVAPGVIMEGLRFRAGTPGDDNLNLFGSNFPGIANTENVLTENILSSFNVDFLKNDYNVVGLLIGCVGRIGVPQCSDSLRVDIFAPGDIAVIGSTTVEATDAFDTFLGISSFEPISSIRLSKIGDTDTTFPGVSVVYFGMSARTVPTMSEWGMFITVAALGIIGLLVMQRRRRALKS
jgi:hypothetical protein